MVSAILVLVLGLALAGAETPVGILSTLSGYNQIVTSSTLRWVSPIDGKVPENAVVGAKMRASDLDGDDQVIKPVWVCRARAHNNMWLAGFLTQDDSGYVTCQASYHGQVSNHQSFEVLQNFEDGARLSWAKWDKLNAPLGGSVTIGTEPLTYVARRKSVDPTSNVNYHIGRVDSGLMGRIVVVEDGVERSYNDGEILVETEPIRYEMSQVKFTEFRARYYREPVTLGATIMRNEDPPTDDGFSGEISRVDTVIAYNHNRTVSWGQGHAILTGLPVTVLHNNGSVMEEFTWARDTFSNASSTYQIEYFLAPGRGVNVTLVGNWTEANIPFSAKITAIYADEVKKTRKILGTRREVGIRNVHPEFGPVYYLHNNSFVPTTTTTTTSTTTSKSTTTSATTSRTTSTSTEEAKPIPASPMEEMNSTTKKSDSADPERKKENQSMLSDGPKAETSEKSGGLNLRGGPILFGALLLSIFA